MAGKSELIVPGRAGEDLADPMARRQAVSAASEDIWASGRADAPAAGTAASAGVILRQKWFILGMFLFLSAAAIPPAWLLIGPTYRSTAVVQVSPIVSRMLYRTDENGVVPFYESYLNTQVSIIRSPTVLQRVIDLDPVKRSHWFTQGGRSLLGAPVPVLERLVSSLEAQPRPRTHLVDVSLETERPEEAALIVNSVVKQYLGYVNETSRDEETRLLETLETEQKARAGLITGYRKTRDILTGRPGVLNSEQLTASLASQLSLLESRRADLQRQVTLMRWKIERAASAQQRSGSTAATAPAQDAADRFAQDAEWRRLNREYEQARRALVMSKQQYGAAHPKIKELTLAVEYAEQSLREREDQLEEAMPSAATAQQAGRSPGESVVDFADPRVLAELASAREKEIELLDRDIEDQRSKAGNAQELARVEGLLKHEEEVYNDLNKRIETLRMESKSPARIGIIAEGLTASKPSKDRRILMTLMGICGALAVSLGAGYVRALGDSRIAEPDQVRHVTQVPFLGQLPGLRCGELPPALGGEGSSIDQAGEGLSALPSCPVSLLEGMRMVRTALLDRLTSSGSHTLLVTSPLPRSGKSSFAIMLAGSLSQLGKRVLLVEADLRRPALAGRLGVSSKQGLAQLLLGAAGDRDVVVRNGALPFDVVLAGEFCPDFNPELLANGVFSACLSRWNASYDFVLLDGPPVLAVADARILARHCEGSVLVMRALHDRRTDAVDAHAMLSDTGRKVLGTVLIGGESRGGRSYGQGYGYGYGAEYYSARRREPADRENGNMEAR